MINLQKGDEYEKVSEIPQDIRLPANVDDDHGGRSDAAAVPY